MRQIKNQVLCFYRQVGCEDELCEVKAAAPALVEHWEDHLHNVARVLVHQVIYLLNLQNIDWRLFITFSVKHYFYFTDWQIHLSFSLVRTPLGHSRWKSANHSSNSAWLNLVLVRRKARSRTGERWTAWARSSAVRARNPQARPTIQQPPAHAQSQLVTANGTFSK